MLCLASTFKQNHVLKRIRLDGIRALNPCIGNQRSRSCALGSKHQIKYKPYVPPYYCDHDNKNMTLKRPMSPHLTIYTPTLTATTSIFQRITGLIVTAYAVVLACSLFLPNGIETYVTMIQSLNLSRPCVFIIKLVLGVPFAFHYFNGIRFCAWNAGRWLALKDVYSTAAKSWIATAILTVVFAIL